uniref:Uncharacterized protein n=1 Tax=Eutreptiella gymnastica TaxID=73025 RepID=A0A7S4GC07_9EUGL
MQRDPLRRVPSSSLVEVRSAQCNALGLFAQCHGTAVHRRWRVERYGGLSGPALALVRWGSFQGRHRCRGATGLATSPGGSAVQCARRACAVQRFCSGPGHLF